MLTEPISIAPNAPADQPLISIDTGNTDVPVSPEVATSRASKAYIGLRGVINKSQDDYFNSIISGTESQTRQDVASQIDKINAQGAYDKVLKIGMKTGELTAEDYALAQQAANPPLTDPRSVFEQKYAKAYMGQLDDTSAREDTNITVAKNEVPEAVQAAQDFGSDIVARRDVALKMYQDVEAIRAGQSGLSKTGDFLKGLVPFYNESKLRGNVPGVSALSLEGLGTNLERQAIKLYELPTLKDFTTQLTSIVDHLKADNPEAAMTFLNSVIGQATSDVTLQNLNTIVDLTMVPDIYAVAKGASMLGLRKAGLKTDVVTAVRDLAKSTELTDKGVPTAAVKAEGAGDVKEAAITRSADKLVSEFKGKVDPVQDAMQAIPTYLRTDAEALGENIPGRLSRELTNRIQDSFFSLADNVIETITKLNSVNRMPALLASEASMRVIEQTVKDRLPGTLGNAVLDINVVHNPISKTLDGFVDLGRTRGTLFFSQQEARNFAKVHGLEQYEIIQKGMGKFIRITKPVNETDDVIRDLLIQTKNDKLPGGWASWVNSAIGGFRSPSETLSAAHNTNRIIATYTPSKLLELAHGELADIRKLASWTIPGTTRKQRWLDWQRVVDNTRNIEDPITKLPGRSYQNYAELDQAYQTLLKRLPDEQEVAAYFAFKRFNEIDRIFRNIRIFTNKARLGTETHTFTVAGEGGVKLESPAFDAVLRKHIPGGDDTVMVMGKNIGEERLYKANSPFWVTPEGKALKDSVVKGEKNTLEIYEPELRPLNDFSAIAADKAARVRYVVADNVKSRPISWDQLPRRGGGHFEYEYDHYIKQAKIHVEKVGSEVKTWYEGDTTIMPMQLRSMGHDIAGKMNEARILLKAGKLDEAKAFVQTHLPMEWSDFRSWFIDHAVEGVKYPARLSLEEPFHVVPKGQMIVDLDKTLEKRHFNFEDGTKRGSLARQNQVQFTGPRDSWEMQTARDIGTRGNPLYNYEPARLVDPIPTMNRAMTRIAHSSFMDDYKLFSVEHWIQEAAPHLRAELSDLRSSPFFHFMNADRQAFKKGADVEKVNNLLTARYNIQQFIGQPSATDALLNRMAQALNDTLYAKFGPKSIDSRLNPAWMLPKIHDPIKFIRGMVTHTKLGLFQIPQLLVQSMTFVDTIGIAGAKYAVPTVHGIGLHYWAKVNGSKAILDALDKKASSLAIPGASRWRVGEWREAFQELGRTGFEHVGHEYALMDSPFHNNIIKNAGNSFLDAGMAFFKGGERNSRLGAWYTAFKEFRDANPTKALTDGDRAQILSRADLLSVNMSRASNSRLQTGALSIPAQFYTYQMRKFELMTGKRLTPKEKGRLFLSNAIMFGIPTSLGVAGYPFGDNLRKFAMEHQYVVGEKFLSSLMMEGLPSMLIALTTGGGDISKGKFYNVGERYGTKGFDNLESLYRGDKTLWDLIGGAAFSTIKGAYEATDGFRAAMMSGIRDDNKAFPLKIEDFSAIFKEIAAVNNGWRAYMAINTGNWMSKKGNIIDTTGVANTIFQSLTGLQSQEVSNINLMSWSLKDQKDLQDYALKRFIAEFHKGIRTQATDVDEANAYFKRAFAYLHIGGYPSEKFSSAVALASQDQPLIDTINWDYYIKKAPDELKANFRDAYQTILNRRKP